MTRVIACLILLPALNGLLCIACQPAAAAELPRPNVLVVFIDDLGWGDVACYGGAEAPTPSLDRLAAEGTRFTQFYTASPICSASRCGLLTGQYPARWRITSYLQTKAGNRACGQADFLDPRAPSYVRAFKSAGYATAHVGKWHLGGGRDVTDAPKFAAYGYDVGLGTYESPEPAAALGLKSAPWSEQIEPQQVPRHERSRWMVDAALDFARQNGTQPWLINLWLDDIHTPFRPSNEARSTPGQAAGRLAYRDVLRETDRQIGRLLEGLRALQAESNTIVVLAGDNGPEPTFDRQRTAGLRGMKWSLYEGGIRTPLIVRWPGVVSPDQRNETTVVGAVDLFPTLCALAGVPAPEGIAFDGEDLSAVLRGERRLRTRPLFWEYGRELAPAAQGLRGFPYPSEPDSVSPNVAVRDGDWKLLINADGSGAELYNLASDQNETCNLSADHPQILKRLTALALAWRRSLP